MRGAARAPGSLRGALRAALVACTCALAGCAMPPATEGGAASDTVAQESLSPIPRQMTVPPGAEPRSNVPSVRYDLAVTGPDELPADGLPGDEPRGEIFERGGASWYGIQFHQRRTASGERFDMGALTAAHKTLPFNTRVCVRSLVNGKEVLVRVNDRGPYTQGRVIDLSRAAADRIGLASLGIKQVALTVIDREGMRCDGELAQPGETDTPSLDVAPVRPQAQPAAARKAPARRAPARRR